VNICIVACNAYTPKNKQQYYKYKVLPSNTKTIPHSNDGCFVEYNIGPTTEPTVIEQYTCKYESHFLD
jgi:hypothetical protein